MTTTHSSPGSNWAPSLCPLHSMSLGWPSWAWVCCCWDHNSQCQAHVSSGSVERRSHVEEPWPGRPGDTRASPVTRQQGTRRRNVSVRSVLAGEWCVGGELWALASAGVTPGAQCYSAAQPDSVPDVKSRQHRAQTDLELQLVLVPSDNWMTSWHHHIWTIQLSPSFCIPLLFIFFIGTLLSKSLEFHINSFACMLNKIIRNASLDYYSLAL